MHVIESIGPVLGIVAFVGLAFLAFLLFQQARDIRRLREWAGRAPERAQEAGEAVQAVAESSREEPEAEAVAAEASGARERLGAAAANLRGRVTARLKAVDRRLPLDARYVLAIAIAIAIVVGVGTSGFGLVGGNGDNEHRKPGSSAEPAVSVLNGTSVIGLADRVDKDVIRKAGYNTGLVANTGSTLTNTVIMYIPGHRADAKALATAVKPKLGETPTQEMTGDVKARAGAAPLALALGIDDSQFGSG